jgi:hypothetical protein
MTKKTKNQNKTNLPNNVSEEEFLKVLENISKRLGHKFRFGYHSYEDMKQQAAIFALEGLQKYDNKRPLENFLWTHVRNRLFNYKRDNYQRPDKPCLGCIFHDPNCHKSTNQCLEFSDKNNCPEYNTWNNRNTNKRNIMKPVGIEDLQEQNINISKLSSDSTIADIVANEQIIKILDENIPAQHRPAYLKLKYGDKVYKTELNKLLECIQEILKDHNYDIKQEDS